MLIWLPMVRADLDRRSSSEHCLGVQLRSGAVFKLTECQIPISGQFMHVEPRTLHITQLALGVVPTRASTAHAPSHSGARYASSSKTICDFYHRVEVIFFTFEGLPRCHYSPQLRGESHARN
jgi:hypothetical protein